MTRTVSLKEAEQNLPGLIQRAAGGEDIVIVAADGSRTRLVTLPSPPKSPRRPAHALKLTALANDFDSPLAGDALAVFERHLESE
ncbi:type II toxin-antitoxin system prevent-host-death family antitoxin [Elstera sp.]|uniref:type II toxin-antitoxin system prevent-host-death family antitoxin n=1 Tax=Elstera sp. TaxID=1916664 RepID=UPI0037BFEBCF